LVVAPVEESQPLAAERLVAEGIGGLLLFGSYAPPALPAELARLRKHAQDRLAPLVMTDEEGGEIQRMANLVGNLPWPREMAKTMTTGQVRALAETVGRRMRAAGVTMDLAPVLDLSDSPGPNARYPDGPRSFSIRPTVAAAYGVAFARGLLAGGVIPVVKHFPGLGQASYNTDFGRASDPRLSVLQKRSLLPFKAAIAAHLPVVMVGHVSVPGLTGRLPASLSSAAVTGLLRHQLGFHGLVLTDSLSAAAIADAGFSVERAAPRAIAAGDDMVLFNATNPTATANAMIASITAAIARGTLRRSRLNEAVTHVLTAKGIKLCSGPMSEPPVPVARFTGAIENALADGRHASRPGAAKQRLRERERAKQRVAWPTQGRRSRAVSSRVLERWLTSKQKQFQT
jgi:beta-N-acetylhexosaminidase